MGQKTHPIGLRLGIIKTWDSRWFGKRNYAELLKEDLLIKRYLKKRLYQAGISRITIERKGDRITIDADQRLLAVDVSEEEMARRRSAWSPPPPRYTAGVLHKYARQVSSASLGAVTDL